MEDAGITKEGVPCTTRILRNLNLIRPLAFIDVETTGLSPNRDRIVEISILRIHPDGKHEYKSHRINPGISIPAEATSVHGIADADVVGEPEFRQYANAIQEFLQGCDLAGFNIVGFDLPFLEAEFLRSGNYFSRQGRYFIDSQVIYHRRDPRDLQAAYRKYCGKEIEKAHSSKEDAKVSAEILDGQLEVHSDLPRDVPGLCACCYDAGKEFIDLEGKFVWVEDEAVCNFGKKHRGRKLKDIAAQDPDYLHWVSGADFSAQVRELAANALTGDFPTKGKETA